MSGSGRRRSSKWDLKDESCMQFESGRENSWSAKAGLSFHERELKHGWLSPELAGGNRHKWSVVEPLRGRRGSRRDGVFDEDRNRRLKAMTSWEGDESYGTRMSPGLDDWRQQNHHKSSKNEWKKSRRSRSRSQSRSRSRSPVCGFGRESGLYDRSRGRLGVSSQLCKDFTAGRCRRGSHCQFLHQGTQTYEDDWERNRKTVTSKYPTPHDSRECPSGSGRSTDCCNDFLKGNCRRGESCRFLHHGASHVAVKRSSNEDRRHRVASPERRSDRETHRPLDVPCKFFAAGNCRNGKNCRFSHQDQVHASPDRSWDARGSLDQNSDDGEKKLWKNWSSTSASNVGTLSENKTHAIGATDQWGTARSADERWGHCLEENRNIADPPIDHIMAERDKADPLRMENTGDSKLASEHRAGDNWLRDMDMSPRWNFKVQPSNDVDKQEHTCLSSCNPSINLEASGQAHDVTAGLPLIINKSSAKLQSYCLREVGTSSLLHDDKNMAREAASSYCGIPANIMSAQSFNQNGLSANAFPFPSLNAVVQGQITIPTSAQGIINPENQSVVQEEKTINKPDIGEANISQLNSRVPLTQNMVSSEQLTHLTNISASLAQLLANGQHLPQLYAVHNSHADNSTEISSLANSEGPVKPNSAIQLNQNAGLRQQYDPMCDSFESEKYDPNNNPPGFSPNLIREKNIADGKLEMSSRSLSPPSLAGAPNGGEYNNFGNLEEPNGKSCQLNEMELGANANSKATKENGVVPKESRKSEDDKAAQEDGPLENIDGDGKTDEVKKGKDAKCVRAFKFALVEFVKELLKPAWKEGQMSKDAYKNIVKKVVDKVTGTMQGAHIPQTQEKIQQYLSFSKLKLTKLVQAYVEKFQKDK